MPRLTQQRLTGLISKLRVWNDTSGQDLIEYALMAAFVAVAAAATIPNLAAGFNAIFSKVVSVMNAAIQAS